MADDIPKLRVPEIDAPGPRKPLSKFEYATLFLDQRGCCKACGKKLVKGDVIDEHLVPRETLPADKCDALENRALYCGACAKAKTVGDQAVIAKSRRVRGERGSQRARREKNGPQIPSRPFMSMNPSGAANFGGLKRHPHLKRTFLGKVVPR